MTKIKNCAVLGFAALTLAAALGAAAPAGAIPGYDGLWSVVIVTEKGTCDRAYRYPIKIINGTLQNAGNDSFVITGKVGTNGAISVRVNHGDKSASGSGQLSTNGSGTGSWSGGQCAGRWEAEKRG